MTHIYIFNNKYYIPKKGVERDNEFVLCSGLNWILVIKHKAKPAIIHIGCRANKKHRGNKQTTTMIYYCTVLLLVQQGGLYPSDQTHRMMMMMMNTVFD